MKRFLTTLAITLACLSLFATTAEAKRFGGGGSFGKQRSITPQQAPKPPAAAPAPGSSSNPPAKGNRWLGPLAGLAIGAGLGALFASMGLSEGMGTMLLIMLVVFGIFFLVSMFRKKQQAPMQFAGSGGSYDNSLRSEQVVVGNLDPIAPRITTSNIPADFPVDNFLRSAKTTFIRLQAANDRKDLNDIREYTTPEMFAEISMQLHERGSSPQKTDVISIQGDLLEVYSENGLALASVRFTGQLRENEGPSESIDEVWHVQKDLNDDKSVWLLAGIQQTVLH